MLYPRCLHHVRLIPISVIALSGCGDRSSVQQGTLHLGPRATSTIEVTLPEDRVREVVPPGWQDCPTGKECVLSLSTCIRYYRKSTGELVMAVSHESPPSCTTGGWVVRGDTPPPTPEELREWGYEAPDAPTTDP